MSAPVSPMCSYWLLPAVADEAMFVAEIGILAARHAAPIFHPHLTLLGDLARDPQQLSIETRTIAAAVPPFSAPVEDVVIGPAFFRSYYALFPVMDKLATIRARACSLFGVNPGAFMPHISLLYGTVEEGAKAVSAAESRARLQHRAILFDRLVLTNSANDVPISEWRILDVAPLSG